MRNIKLLWITVTFLITVILFSACSSGDSLIMSNKTALAGSMALIKNSNGIVQEDITQHIVTPTPTPMTIPTPTPEVKSQTSLPENTITKDVQVQGASGSSVSVQSKPPALAVGTGKIIVIDPGHADHSNSETEPMAPGSSEMKIKDGGGAEGVATATPEYLVNMNVAVALKNILQQKGYTVIMTKTQNSESLGNVDRAKIGNNANASLVIRIHADSVDNNSVKGASMLVPSPINDNTKKIYSESMRCGQIVLNTLVNEVGMNNRGVTETDQMTGFNWSTVPVILVEMGFLSNLDEDKLLSSSSYENKLANGLANGIMAAVK